MRQAKLFGNPAPGSPGGPANQAGDFSLPTWGPSGSDDFRDFDPVMIEGLLEGGRPAGRFERQDFLVRQVPLQCAMPVIANEGTFPSIRSNRFPAGDVLEFRLL